MVQNLQLLFKNVPTTTIDRYGSLKDWINEASNEKYWTVLVQCLLHSTTHMRADAALQYSCPFATCSAPHGEGSQPLGRQTAHNTTATTPPPLGLAEKVANMLATCCHNSQMLAHFAQTPLSWQHKIDRTHYFCVGDCRHSSLSS